MRKDILYILLILLLKFKGALAQDPYYYTIDKSKGLPSNSVYDIFQDKTGYIWFATDEGLSRYNGATFKTYFSDQQTSRSGSSIGQDKYGRIWYSNFDGYLYYVLGDKLHTLSQKTPIGYYRYGIIEDLLYVMTSEGVVIYDLGTLKSVKQLTINEKQILYTKAIGKKFYVLASVLYEIDTKKVLRKVELPQDFYSYLGRSIIMQETPDGILFVSKVNNVSYLKMATGFVKLDRPKQFSYVQNSAYTANELWFCNPQGAHKISTRGAEQTVQKSYFNKFNISFVFKDNRQNYWFSTLNKGLLLVPDLKNILLELQPRPIVIKNIGSRIIASSENECIYSVDLNSYGKRIIHAGRNNHTINQLFIDSLRNRLMFTSNKFTILKNNKQVEAEAYVAVKDIKPLDGKYYSFAASGYSGLFRLSNSGTSIWDSLYLSLQQKVEKNNFNEVALINGINGKATVYNAANQTIYYATNVGLMAFNLTEKREVKYKNKPLYIKFLTCYKDIVYCLATDGKVLVVDPKNKVNELPVFMDRRLNFVSKMKVIGNSLYVITSSAIYEYNLDDKRMVNTLNISPDFEVSDVDIYGDKYVFATSKGLLLQNRLLNKPKTYPALVLENVMVNDDPASTTTLADLKYYQNDIAINYSLLAYTPQEKYPIYYKVNDNGWQLLNEHSGSLKLSSLAPGSYKVSFKLVTDKDIISYITFAIAKPFWLSTFFLVASIAILIGLSYLIYRYKLKQNNAQNNLLLARLNLEKNLNQSKLKAIKSQMNPHFFYNALNTIQSYILASDKKQAVNYLSKFSALTRTILQMSENEYINLSEEIKMIGFYLDIEKARFDEGFEYTIRKEGIVGDEELRIPSLLLQPYVENAIKHGLLHKEGQKHLDISFEKRLGILEVTIDDNGIGRVKSGELNQIKQQKHQSFATEAIQNRIELLNQNNEAKITVTYVDKMGRSHISLGTTVIIQIPLTNTN